MNNTREKVATSAGKISDTKFSLKNGKVKIFPFIIRNGYQNVSERGFESKGTDPYWFSFFQKVFTGSETITATWEDSTELNVRDASLGTYNYDFQVGKWYEGSILPGSHSQQMEINDVNGNEGFLAMQESGDITILFSRNELEEDEHDFFGYEDDMFKLYIIPESKFENKWLYISNVTTYNNPKNKAEILTEVTFTSLKDKLETSGRALEQYVQYAAPGEPYAFPFILYDGSVIVSPLRTSEYVINPVKYLQVELQGANAFSSVTVFGRRLYWDSENEKWFTSPSKFLLPYRFANPQANPFAKTSSPSKNFYCFIDETVETRSTSEWLTTVKALDTGLAPIQNMGVFTMTGNWISTGHRSNPVVDGKHTDYFNGNWKPLTGISGAGIEYDTPGNLYCSDKVKYLSTDTMQQVLIKNSMCNIIQLELPLDMKQTRPYRWSTIPVIGFWTRWLGDRALNAHSTSIKTNHICYFIDTNLATLAANANAAAGTYNGYGNLQMFNGEDAPSMLNPQSANTTICFELSDKVSFTDNKYNNNPSHPRPLSDGVDTVYFSQKTDEYGVNLHNDGTAFVLNCEDNSINVKYVDYGFIIDNVIVNALHIGKIKVSCYGKSQANTLDNPSFTQTVMSNSMFESHNIRNWTTNITLGTWDSNWSNGVINWPLSPQKEILNEITINAVGNNFKTPLRDNYILAHEWDRQYFPQDKQLWEHSDRWTSCYNTWNLKNNEIIPYTDLPGNISDRQDFIDKIQYIQFDINGSYFNSDTGDCNLNGKKIVINMNDLSSSYTLSKTQALGAFGLNDYQPFSLLNKFELKYTTEAEKHPDIDIVDGGANQLVIINIVLRENGFQYSIDEKYTIASIGWQGYNPGPRYTTVIPYRNARQLHIWNYNAQIKIPKIAFIPKES